MGMFDYLACEYPLPGNPPEFVKEPGHRFQTKDLTCELATYKITSSGRLIDFDGTEYDDRSFTGTIDFYGSNLCSSVNGISFTENGEDAEWVEYRAVFVDGSIKTIEETGRTREPALPESAMKSVLANSPPTDEDIATRKARAAEDLTGCIMWYCHGGLQPSDGHEVTVVYSGPREWVIQHPPSTPGGPKFTDDRLEIIDRRMRDVFLWDSLEAAQRASDERQAEHERVMAGYRMLMDQAGKPCGEHTGFADWLAEQRQIRAAQPPTAPEPTTDERS